MQQAVYFVLLFFVKLTSADLSILRVTTRVPAGGHGIDEPTLRKRFPKTQKAISGAIKVAHASVLADNSLTPAEAFAVCRVQLGIRPSYDIRDSARKPQGVISAWMDVVSPR
jgi:predicted ABC-type ATPase